MTDTRLSMAGRRPGRSRTGRDRGRRRRNWLQLVFLLLAMAALLGFCGWIVAGPTGILWSVLAGAIGLLLVRRVPVNAVLRSMGARELPADRHPQIDAMFTALCRHAGLAPIPRLYRLPEALPLAFSLGVGDGAAVVVADSLLAGLTERELGGILAHEIVHLRSGDIRIKQLGFVLGWLTRTLRQLGFFLLFLGLLLHTLSLAEFPFLSLLVLATAPVAVDLLQLALSRAREAEADLEAAGLTGDPAGLASALDKLRQWQEWRLRRLFPNARMFRLPTLLSDHPPTAERIRNLRRLAWSGGSG